MSIPTCRAVTAAAVGGLDRVLFLSASWLEGDSMASSSAQAAEVTVSGVMIEGLRSNCRILQTDQRRYALTGPGTAARRVGDQVTVTGRPRPDLISPCGSVFVVTSLQ